MLKVLKARLLQGYQTSAFPSAPPRLSDRFMGLPEMNRETCKDGCEECVKACPLSCVSRRESGIEIDLGGCILCGECAKACPSGAIKFGKDWRMSSFTREALRFDGSGDFDNSQRDAIIKSLFGRSLKIRQVSAGGCNACELDFNVLNTLAWDMGRFGIQAVASPRHADGILVTGPVTKNMREALLKTWDAIPQPRFAIACGACAISGGIYGKSPEACGGVPEGIKIDLYIPGCPPHPATILDGILRLMGRLP